MKALFLYPRACITGLLCTLQALAVAQVSDQFTDGDFTQNPAWSGDVGDFEVDASDRLHLLSVGVDTSALSTPNTSMDDAEWNIWFHLAFAPSDNNYVRIYLVSNQASLKENLDGYFLRYGENGAADNIELWRQDGNALTKIIDGTPNPNASSTGQSIRIKVTRSSAGSWELFSDYNGGYAYQAIGSVVDNQYGSTSYIGVWCKYTSGNAAGFYFDDIYAGPAIVDTTAPTVLDVNTVAADSVSVIFSEPVDPASAITSANYNITGIGFPSAVIYAATQPDRVKLALPIALVSEQSYAIHISSVQDMAANTMANHSGSFLFYAPSPHDVVLSEIMADPSPEVGLPNAEFVELYNRKNIPIDVTGWKIKAGNITRIIPSGLIPADSFIVLSVNPLPVGFSGINAVAVPSFPSLANAGATVSILSPSDLVINEITYSSAWYRDAAKDDGGWTLEMINGNDLCNGAANWIASNDSSGGTPGRRNSVDDSQPVSFTLLTAVAISASELDVGFSQQPDMGALSAVAFSVNNGMGNPDSVQWSQGNTVRLFFGNAFAQQTDYQLTVSPSLANCVQQPITGNLSVPFGYYAPAPNDIIITEIMADPDPPVALPNAEYVELYNRTAFPIDITGWKIRAGSSVRTVPYGVIPADSFIVLTVDPLPPPYIPLNAVAVPSFPSITNIGATISILSPADEVIHEVSFGYAWYQDPAKDDGGWSLEMVNPNNLCGGMNNWKACQDFMGGTPGMRNSVNDTQPAVFEIKAVFAADSSLVDVYFSQYPDVAQLDASHFSIDQGLGNPDSVLHMGNAVCRLYFSSVFSEQSIYQLSVSPAVLNCVQESITGDLQHTFTFYTARQNDVIITEIMADEEPSQGLPPYEYVEIYNRTSLPVQLGNWRFRASNSVVVLPNIQLPPHAYLTLTKPGAETFFAGPVLGIPGFPSLNNTAGTLTLSNQVGNQIHSVSYADTWIRESFKRDGGWALEMKDVNNPCAGKENWDASVHDDGGTPGAANSIKTDLPDQIRPRPVRVGIPAADSLVVYFSEPLKENISAAQFQISDGIGHPAVSVLERPHLTTVAMKLNAALLSETLYEITFADTIKDCAGNPIEMLYPLRFRMPEFPAPKDIILNEVLFDEKSGGGDYIELFNRSAKAIDLKDIYIGNYDSTVHQMADIKTITARSAILMPGGYLLLSTDKADVYAQYYTADPNAFWDVASMPSLTNSGGSIAVCDNNFLVLDAFTFTDAFHFSLLDNKDGVSLERINTETATQNRYNWTSASAAVGYGTPGYKNSQAGMPMEQDGALSVSPEVFSPDQDGFEDVLFITYEFPSPGNVISINIYDEAGRLMKRLVNNEYCGITGQYTWDGGTDNNIRPKVGIYVVMAEWFNENGEKGRAKKVVVLGTKL